MTTAIEEPELRICTDCCEIKPLTDFRKRYRGRDDRMHQCQCCHARTEKSRRQRKKAIARGFRMQAIATAARRPRSMRQLLTLLEFGVHASGGFEKLLEDWYAGIQECIEQRISTPRILGYYQGMIALAVRICPYSSTRQTKGSTPEHEGESGSRG